MPDNRSTPAGSSRPASVTPETNVLVLQGGGALGSYKGGTVGDLEQAGYAALWVAGILVGGVQPALDRRALEHQVVSID